MLRKEIQKTRIKTKQQEQERQRGGCGNGSVGKQSEAIPWLNTKDEQMNE